MTVCCQQVRDSLKWYAALEILFTLPGIPQHMRKQYYLLENSSAFVYGLPW